MLSKIWKKFAISERGLVESKKAGSSVASGCRLFGPGMINSELRPIPHFAADSFHSASRLKKKMDEVEAVSLSSIYSCIHTAGQAELVQ